VDYLFRNPRSGDPEKAGSKIIASGKALDTKRLKAHETPGLQGGSCAFRPL
jgi:hypothetical protein